MNSNACVAERCDFHPGDIIDNQWNVEKFLGEGTFGQVFKVTDRQGTPYALKLLKLWEVIASERPNLLKRFDREYEVGRIKSDYLVHSTAKGNVRGNAYIVMEFCSEGDLHNAHKNNSLDLPLLASHVLLGLRDLHINGKVHRDLKPENVLLRSMSHAVLTDFGISGDQNNRLTQRGWSGVPQQRFGTIAYMPPEQINPKRGNATVLPTTDIFSFGVMMYQLLTGMLPFGPLSSEADVPRYVNNGKSGAWDRNALRNAHNGQAWERLVEGCLEPDFKQRIQTIDDTLPLLPPSESKGSMKFTFASNAQTFNQDASRGIILRVMQGEEQGRTYDLPSLLQSPSSLLLMGRQSGDVWNHIGLRENESCYISRQHCTIEYDRDYNVWVIRDGQFRVQCEVGLRMPHVFPCKQCTAYCRPSQSRMGWKNSLNGTFVNSDEVSSDGMVIRPGDIISIGDVKMRVEGA